MTDTQVRVADGWILAHGEFPSGSPDPAVYQIVTLTPEQEAAYFEPVPGQRVLEADGTITIIPPPPPPPIFTETERVIDREVETTDATPTAFPPFNLHLQTIYTIRVDVMAIADNGQELTAEYAISCKRLNQAAIKVGEREIFRINDTNTATWGVAFAAAGNGLVLTVTGVSGRTISWLVSASIHAFTPQGRAPGTE